MPGRGATVSAAFWSLLEAVVIVFFFAMLLVMFVQVLSRYALGVGVPWTDETSRFLFIAQIFLGAAVAQRYGAQITITVLLDVLPARPRAFLEALSDLLTLVIAGILVAGSVQMVGETANVMASTINVSFSYLYLVQGIGIALLSLLVLRDLVVKLDAMRGKE